MAIYAVDLRACDCIERGTVLVGDDLYACPPNVPARFGGMSGVVFGLIGYLWMKGRTQPQQGLGIANEQLVMTVLWMLLCIGGAFGPIANAAHVTGFIAGILVGGRQSLWTQLRQITK